jgi:hypothetical protein
VARQEPSWGLAGPDRTIAAEAFGANRSTHRRPPARAWRHAPSKTPPSDADRITGGAGKLLKGSPSSSAIRLERCVTAAAPLIRSHAPLLRFCRSDTRFANVIARSDGRIGLVDWEDSGLRDPPREVADLLMHPNQEDLLDIAAWQPFLSVYVESRRDDTDFERRLRGYLAIFPVFWLGILLADGMRRTADGDFGNWMINEMEPNARLRRYLARAQAWPDPDPTEALAKLGDVAFF